MELVRGFTGEALKVIFVPTRAFFWLAIHLFPPNEEIDAKINAKQDDKICGNKLDVIYSYLGILDSKAQGLMRYNGIILAIVALTLKTGAHEHMKPGTNALVFTSLVSILLCLLIVGVFWRFLEFVENDASAELRAVRRVLMLREAAYQLAWWFAIAATVLMFFQFPEFVEKHGAETSPT